MTDQALLPCPFCRAPARSVRQSAGMPGTMGYDRWHGVSCTGCNACVGSSDRRFRTVAEAIAAWNRRTPQPEADNRAGAIGQAPGAGVVEALRDRFHDALFKYAALSYAEGKEGRDHDTINGDAAACLQDLSEIFSAALSAGDAAPQQGWVETSAVLGYVGKLMNDVHVVRPKDGYTPEQERELDALRRIARRIGDDRYTLAAAPTPPQPAAQPAPHLSICAAVDDTMAGHPVCDCGAAAQPGEEATTFLSEVLVKSAIMTDADEALVKQRECPKCHDRLFRQTEGGEMCFMQCIGCGAVFVTAARAAQPATQKEMP